MWPARPGFKFNPHSLALEAPESLTQWHVEHLQATAWPMYLPARWDGASMICSGPVPLRRPPPPVAACRPLRGGDSIVGVAMVA